MTTEEMEEELQLLVDETTTALGGTDQTYVRFLKMLQEAKKLTIPSRLFQGQLVFFKYFPQNEAFLKSNKYYDKYPLVLITDVYRGGFEGVNVHYLDPTHRSNLFDVIMRGLPTIKAGDEWRTRLRVDYDRLSARRQFRFFKPCYKKYRWKGMKRRPVVVPFELWEKMMSVEIFRFENARSIKVFRESYKKAIKQR
jgi:hypothetical protein